MKQLKRPFHDLVIWALLLAQLDLSDFITQLHLIEFLNRSFDYYFRYVNEHY